MSILADILGILSFVVSIITMLLTFRIKRKLEKTSDKNQFLRERDYILGILREYCVKINQEEIRYNDILIILREIQGLVIGVIRYNIWNNDDVSKIHSFLEFSKGALHRIDSYRVYLPPRENYCYLGEERIEKDEVVNIYKTIISNKFRNEYCEKLNEVMSILNADSSVLNE